MLWQEREIHQLGEIRGWEGEDASAPCRAPGRGCPWGVTVIPARSQHPGPAPGREQAAPQAGIPFQIRPTRLRGSGKQQSKIPHKQLLGTGEFFLKKTKGKMKPHSPARRIQNLPQGADELQRALTGESTVGHTVILAKK